jgi:hypothetical protein
MTAKKPKAGPRQAAKPGREMPGKVKESGLRLYWPRLFLIIPVLAVVWVPSYNSLEPALGGVPFFYWYQLAWILIAAVIVLGVYLIETRVTKVTQRASAHVDPGATGDVL